jgi:hypothetical protein
MSALTTPAEDIIAPTESGTSIFIFIKLPKSREIIDAINPDKTTPAIIEVTNKVIRRALVKSLAITINIIEPETDEINTS